MEAYCVKCRGKKEMVGGHEEKMDSGMRVMKGHCTECNTRMNSFLGKAKD